MEITKENGQIKAKVIINDKYGDEMLTMVNGWQWSGFPLNENLAVQIVDALNEYLAVLNEKSKEG